MKRITYTRVAQENHDAGLFRQYLAQNFGDVLTYGGGLSVCRKAIRMASKLARLSGLSVEEVIETAKADFALSDIKPAGIQR